MTSTSRLSTVLLLGVLTALPLIPPALADNWARESYHPHHGHPPCHHPVRHHRRCAAPAPAGPPSVSFCNKPPVVKNLDLAAYATGTWFQIAGSGSALQFGGSRCLTANYTLRDNGTVAVLNCGHIKGAEKPFCVRATASPRENATETAELSVAFPGVPKSPFNPGQYSVAAVVGKASMGYAAAAVYQCAAQKPGFFIIARSLERQERILKRLKRRLRCAGYGVDDVNFVKIEQSKDCLYFFGGQGFLDGGGPPPGVGSSGAGGPPPGVTGSSGAGPPPGVVPA